MKKLVFTAKPFEGFLYKWSPDENVIKKNKKNQSNKLIHHLKIKKFKSMKSLYQ